MDRSTAATEQVEEPKKDDGTVECVCGAQVLEVELRDLRKVICDPGEIRVAQDQGVVTTAYRTHNCNDVTDGNS